MFSFCKMQATGNDFIILNNLENNLNYSYKLLAEYLCNRHFGIGADGLIILERSFNADFKMRIFNQDGTEAEMCGNGIRCLGKFIFDNNISSKKEMEIETLGGIKSIKILKTSEGIEFIEVNMGTPIFELKKIPVFCKENNNILKIEELEIFPVSIGNPHAVCFVNELQELDIEKYGKLIENYKYFPNKTNVEFVKIIDRQNIKIRIWERGVGETLSCGTGCTAAAVIANKNKMCKNDINVEVRGGKLKVIVKEDVILSGNAIKVFDGQIAI